MENNFKFYNTLTRQIDTVVPRVDGKIGMYTCESLPAATAGCSGPDRCTVQKTPVR